MHIYSITFRGTFPIGEWNRIIQMLYDQKIQYRCADKLAPTRDEAGMLQFYSRLIYWSETEFPYDTKRVKCPWGMLENMLKGKA